MTQQRSIPFIPDDAPFRAFLEERKATGAKGGNRLFFGGEYIQKLKADKR
jgi:hypothetical protein